MEGGGVKLLNLYCVTIKNDLLLICQKNVMPIPGFLKTPEENL